MRVSEAERCTPGDWTVERRANKVSGRVLWAELQSEIEGLQASLAEAEIAALAESVRGWLRRDDFPRAATALSAAQAKYADRPIWATPAV